MAIKVLQSSDIEKFNNSAEHILHTTYWGEFLASLKRRVEYIIDGKKGYLLSFNKIPFTDLKIAYFYKPQKPTKELINFVKTNYKNILYIKFEPEIENTIENVKYMHSIGLRKSKWNIFTSSTMYVDLSKSKEELFNNFDTNTKRNVKKAEKLGVIVEERTDREAINIFLELNKETTKRQVYFSHSDFYYINMWKQMTKSGKALMLVARYNEEYIGAIILFFHNGKLYYPYGASKQTNTGAMSLLHFEAMQRAIGDKESLLNNEGLTIYDLWGCLSKEEEDSSLFEKIPLSGVHRFKRGLGGEITTFVGSYDYVIKPVSYFFFNIISQIRKSYYSRLKSLKKRNA